MDGHVETMGRYLESMDRHVENIGRHVDNMGRYVDNLGIHVCYWALCLISGSESEIKMNVKRINWEKIEEVQDDTVWAKVGERGKG